MLFEDQREACRRRQTVLFAHAVRLVPPCHGGHHVLFELSSAHLAFEPVLFAVVQNKVIWLLRQDLKGLLRHRSKHSPCFVSFPSFAFAAIALFSDIDVHNEK